MEEATMEHEHRPAHDDSPLRSVDEVRAEVLERVPILAPIDLPLQEAYGCVLAEDVRADADIPGFSSSGMDGFAIRASDVAAAGTEAPVRLRVAGRAAVGRQPEATVGGGEAVAIATGAPVPAGADAIVPIEDTQTQGDGVLVFRPTEEGRHIRPAGQDVKAGDVLVATGRRIGAPELGLLAGSGRASFLVHPRARVVILSTGDELVEPGRPLAYGQVRDANGYTLYAGLRDAGAVPYLGGIVHDDPEALKEAVLGFASRADCFISSGGVSVGERDVVKRAFFRRGDVAFYRVAMQPGMPQAFGVVEDTPYFGLPGNPVSVFVSYELFIRPAVLKMMGRRDILRPEVVALLDQDLPRRRDRLQFARVRVRRDQGRWHAVTTGESGSNLLSTVSRANGLALIPAGADVARAGSEVKVMLFRALED
jgi:molybdopterin molybdotransferase